MVQTANTRTQGLKKSTAMTLAVLGVSVALAGCTRSSNLNQGGFFPTTNSAKVDPLPAAPTARVEGRSLGATRPTPPPAPTNVTPQAAPVEVPKPQVETPTPVEESVQVAKVEPTPAPSGGGLDFTQDGASGAWTVSSGGNNCQIFLTRTTWTGGLRAATRACAGTDLRDVQAWKKSGKQIVLVDSNGSQVGSLRKTAEARFDGASTKGTAITFSR